MTISKIVFFNGHQHGDIANNRGIINYVTPYIQELDLNYVHIKHPEAIYFNDHIKTYNYSSTYPDRKLLETHVGCIRGTPSQFIVHDDTLFINLWIDRSPWFNQNKQYTGSGITSQALFAQTKEVIDIITQYVDTQIKYPTNIAQTMPSSIKHPKHKKQMDHFIKTVLLNYRKKVLIPNGKVESNQCAQFDMADFLLSGGIVEKYKDVLFLLTCETKKTSSSNMVCINDIVPIPNLNEIDYVSRYCDVLITRASGPGCVVSTQENFYDKSKTFISFTKNKYIAFEALSSVEAINNEKWGNRHSATMIWSNDFSQNNICSTIEKTII